MEKPIVGVKAETINKFANLAGKYSITIVEKPLIGSDAYLLPVLIPPPLRETRPYFLSNSLA